MSDMQGRDRREVFTPPPHPDWVQTLNDEGRGMDIASIVPLDAESLIRRAMRNTGLSNFGSDEWREPFEILTKALDDEAQLTLTGRLMTGGDLLIYLEARLRIEEEYRLHPEIEDGEINSPLFITGQGRTGTSELLNLLASDLSNAVTLNWEAMFPCPPPEAASYRTDPRIAKSTAIMHQTYRVTPEMRAIQLYGGDIPCENTHMHCLSFRSAGYINAHMGQAPSYLAYMAKQDSAIAYAYEKRVLKLLQWKNPRARWVFKSPQAIIDFPSILKVYPDANFVLTVRDPIKSLSSITNHIGTLTWVRSDVSFIGGSDKDYLDPKGIAGNLNRIVDWMEDGTIPKSQMMAVQFSDFITKPMEVAEAIYERYGITMTPEGRAGIQAYIDANRRDVRPKHSYNTGASESIAAERKLFERFQTYFSIPSEV